MTEVSSPTSAMPVDPLQAGRDALARHAWPEAFERLSEADRAGRLTGADLERLAEAAFFAAHADAELDIKERAFRAHLADGDQIRAAYLALDLAHHHYFAGKESIAAGWVRRAEKILGAEGDTYAHGYLTLIRSELAGMSGDPDTALALAEQAIAIGERAADADLKAYAQMTLGELKLASGSTTEGFALMEEASFAAVNGELTPFTSGLTACRMISACRDLTDYRRATEWIEATEKYCRRQSVSGFPGVCRIHRAEVAVVSGAWERAETELQQATIELEDYKAGGPQADGFYAIGDIRRLKGDFAGSEEALREAHARGRSPHPALALIRLAEGKVKAATAAINGAVADETGNRWSRARLLPAQVEIAIASGDLERARAALDDLSGIVGGYPSPALEAGRQVAVARLRLAEADPAAAIGALRSAIRSWREVGAPYEVARARALLAGALRATGDEEDADLELRAALEEFRRLGAQADASVAERELRDAEDRRSGPVQVRKTFMFTDIVGSTALAEALGDQAWERLLRWHDDTLRGLIATGGGHVVNSTGDGFFVAFDAARRGVECAIAIQRALRDHRAATGFAISVRIGLHAAEANQRGDDYSGMGVHVAARVAALAGGGEILATAEALTETGDLATSQPRDAAVKGVSAPVSV
ncbi:MAG TPA: adenylate/guanylate cyclase domain-containing protein, partial [Candidatus Sulfomarinibacteraceae bacterium]|nr:adenylate/guanylate cyclase domain-containing protein [Candidatus Sulfomarinibacteraceae bacterium]